jgi:hypothetical protein
LELVTLATLERDLRELSQQQEHDQHDGDVAHRVGQHLGRAGQQRVLAQGPPLA